MRLWHHSTPKKGFKRQRPHQHQHHHHHQQCTVRRHAFKCTHTWTKSPVSVGTLISVILPLPWNLPAAKPPARVGQKVPSDGGGVTTNKYYIQNTALPLRSDRENRRSKNRCHRCKKRTAATRLQTPGSVNEPSYTAPLANVNFPSPFIRFAFQVPTYVSPEGHVNMPSPAICPPLYSPLYLKPSDQHCRHIPSHPSTAPKPKPRCGLAKHKRARV